MFGGFYMKNLRKRSDFTSTNEEIRDNSNDVKKIISSNVSDDNEKEVTKMFTQNERQKTNKLRDILHSAAETDSANEAAQICRDVLEKAKGKNLVKYVNVVPSDCVSDWFVSPDGSVKSINGIVVSNMDGSDKLEHYIMRKINLIEYDEKLHRKYNNIDSVNCDSANNIPDTDCIIGVPVTILTNGTYDRDELELIDATNDTQVDGVQKFKRILVKLKKYQ